MKMVSVIGPFTIVASLEGEVESICLDGEWLLVKGDRVARKDLAEILKAAGAATVEEVRRVCEQRFGVMLESLA